jgi:NAD(P)-dependent dehydrogenase (short-subunit alcohol dehydrogenase family)
VTVNGDAVTSGNASNPILLSVGRNTITAVVTAEDNVTTKTYTITITRRASHSSSGGSVPTISQPETGVDIFVNNAGITVMKRFTDTLPEDIDNIFNTNLKEQFIFFRTQ